MSRYKRLNLGFPYKYMDDEHWWHELLDGKHFYDMTPIPPVFKRPGWYYDRETNTSWIETCRGCWSEKSPRMFKYTLSCELHTSLPEKVEYAIGVLIAYNMCPKSLKQLLRKEHEVRQLKDTYRNSRKWMLRTIKQE